MAQRRMIGKQVCGTDAFRKLTPASQALYYQLLIDADDDGFVSNVEGILSSCPKLTSKNLTELINKRFVLAFKSNIVCIKHFLIMNAIRKDRYTPTAYQKELESLAIKPNKSYTEKKKKHGDGSSEMATKWQPNGNQMATKWQPMVAVDKDRIDKDSINKIDQCACAHEDRSDPIQSEFTSLLNLYGQFNPSPLVEVPEETVSAFLKKHRVDEFQNALEKAKKSDYLSGRAGSPKMKLGWILEEENFFAVLSGKYDSWKEAPEKASKSYDLEAFFNAAVSKGRKE